ncbi:hypothetical protein D3C87_1568580 [compost metagenome]
MLQGGVDIGQQRLLAHGDLFLSTGQHLVGGAELQQVGQFASPQLGRFTDPEGVKGDLCALREGAVRQRRAAVGHRQDVEMTLAHIKHQVFGVDRKRVEQTALDQVAGRLVNLLQRLGHRDHGESVIAENVDNIHGQSSGSE